MRKQTKLVAVLSASALLALGATMTSFAAQGWAEEDGTWVYYDKNGDKVQDVWKKSGDLWFYLDSNGEMTTDELIEYNDNYYYLDENGAMATNRWVAIENEDAGEDDEPEHYWYYFQNNGKAYKRSDSASSTAINAKTINGKKYAFDTDGKMLYGWVNDGERKTGDDAWKEGIYYFGTEDDGAMSTGWRLVDIVDDDAQDDQPGDEFWDEDQSRWFYFQTSGKKKAGGDKEFTDKKINGAKYGFDKYGRMVASWYTKATTDKASQGNATYSSTFMYFNSPESGARYTKGWFKVVPGYYLQQNKYEDGSEYWYYADKDGELYSNVIKTIKGKKYGFDNYGRMISGLVFLEMKDTTTSTDIVQKFADDADDYPYDTEDGFDKFVQHYAEQINKGTIRSYYFGSSEDGSMKTGSQTVEIDGDNFKFKFKTGSSLKGAGENKLDESKNKLYTAGKQVKADKDDKYKVYQVGTSATGAQTVTAINAADFVKDFGKVDTTYKKDDETKYTIEINDGNKYFLVNSSGSVVKSKTNAKDGEDYKFNVDKNRKITSVIVAN